MAGGVIGSFGPTGTSGIRRASNDDPYGLRALGDIVNRQLNANRSAELAREELALKEREVEQGDRRLALAEGEIAANVDRNKLADAREALGLQLKAALDDYQNASSAQAAIDARGQMTSLRQQLVDTYDAGSPPYLSAGAAPIGPVTVPEPDISSQIAPPFALPQEPLSDAAFAPTLPADIAAEPPARPPFTLDEPDPRTAQLEALAQQYGLTADDITGLNFSDAPDIARQQIQGLSEFREREDAAAVEEELARARLDAIRAETSSRVEGYIQDAIEKIGASIESGTNLDAAALKLANAEDIAKRYGVNSAGLKAYRERLSEVTKNEAQAIRDTTPEKAGEGVSTFSVSADGSVSGDVAAAMSDQRRELYAAEHDRLADRVKLGKRVEMQVSRARALSYATILDKLELTVDAKEKKNVEYLRDTLDEYLDLTSGANDFRDVINDINRVNYLSGELRRRGLELQPAPTEEQRLGQDIEQLLSAGNIDLDKALADFIKEGTGYKGGLFGDGAPLQKLTEPPIPTSPNFKGFRELDPAEQARRLLNKPLIG